MARPLRIEFPGALYLVTARTLPRQRLCRNEGETRDFLSRLPALTAAFDAVFHGFCVLPNHYHLLLETPRANLSRIVHRLNAGYTATVNASRSRRGPLLRDRYRSLLLDEEWLVPLSVHVHLNPVRKRLARDPEAYLGSSARAYVRGGAPVPGLETTRTLTLAGGREAYWERLRQALAAPPPAPWPQVWRQAVLGGDELRQRVLAAVEGRDPREIPGFSSRPEGVSVDAVVSVVAEQTGLDPEQITGGKFQRVLARKVAIYLARRCTGLTLREVGRAFGVDYTSVHMTSRRVEMLRGEDASVDRFVGSLEERLARSRRSDEPTRVPTKTRRKAKSAERSAKGGDQLKLF